jgi:hypothetical protein
MENSFVHECPLPPPHFEFFTSPETFLPPTIEEGFDLSTNYRKNLSLPIAGAEVSSSQNQDAYLDKLKEKLRALLKDMVDLVANPSFDGNIPRTDSIYHSIGEITDQIKVYR